MRPVGSTFTSPRVGDPDGPAGTYPPESPRSKFPISSGVRERRGTTSCAAKCSERATPSSAKPSTSWQTVPADSASQPALFQRQEQRLRRFLQQIQEVRRGNSYAGKTFGEFRRRFEARAAVLGEEAFVQAVGCSGGAAQAGNFARAEAQDGGGQVAKGLTFGSFAEDVEAASYREVFDLTQVTVHVVEEVAELLRLLFDPEVAVKLGVA